jgi:hypothetical protein
VVVVVEAAQQSCTELGGLRNSRETAHMPDRIGSSTACDGSPRV